MKNKMLFESSLRTRMQEMAGVNSDRPNVELPVNVSDQVARRHLLVLMNANELKVIFDRIQQSFALKVVDKYKDQPEVLKNVVVPGGEKAPIERPQLYVTFYEPQKKVNNAISAIADKLNAIENEFISLVRENDQISEEAEKFKQDALGKLFNAASKWGVDTLKIITRGMGDTILHTGRGFNSMQEMDQFVLAGLLKNPRNRLITGDALTN